MYLFVYGTLKKNFQYHFLLKEAIFKCEGITQKKFLMYSNGAYPLIVPNQFDNMSGYIKGEIYEIDDKLLKKLDEFEDVPYEYLRIQENVKCIKNNIIFKCFLYISTKQYLPFNKIRPEDKIISWKK